MANFKRQQCPNAGRDPGECGALTKGTKPLPPSAPPGRHPPATQVPNLCGCKGPTHDLRQSTLSTKSASVESSQSMANTLLTDCRACLLHGSQGGKKRWAGAGCWGMETSGREQPIFSTKAHVFQIDPETKKNWLPASKVAVSVSYYYDSTRNTYRIISVDGSKAIINSTITPNMTFTKTSQKFGQWSDPRANTVYGLGFTTEGELTKFIEKFKEIKEMTRRSVAGQKPSAEINGGMDGQASPQPVPARPALHQRTSSLSSIQTDTTNLRERRNSFTQGSNGVTSNPTEAQLKYENDRLKLALAQSSANAKKWEVELTTLKNNNARLTAALQESTANVEEWKKQLATYKEENARLRKKGADKDQDGGVANKQALQQELHTLNEESNHLRQENQIQQQEISRLSKQIDDMSIRESQMTGLQTRIQNLEEENHSLSLKIQDVQRQLQEARSGRETESREILTLQEALGAKITDMYELHEQIVAAIRKESHS
ncbi:hypothetical protein BaRGS_00016081 [Batillaria attramentaria]|uniref:WH1 domain-containing protein n=1 Tax=Batillaria attramentaria TaxID=370345 RepID=A0ABD0KZI3_9CAEN